MSEKSYTYMNPYAAGIFLGVVLFASFALFGHGLGASGSVAIATGVATDAIAPGHVEGNAYLVNLVRQQDNPLDNWLVFEIIGVILGGLVSGALGGRVRKETFHGPRIDDKKRLLLAVLGGAVAGFGVRMSRGCTSSQALSGGAVLSAGSWAFMFSVFAGAYMTAYFVRKQWY